MGHGFAVFAATEPGIVRAVAREAEGLGYGSFWVNHPGPVDGLQALGPAAAETRRIDLGVGVVPLHTRGPDSIVAGIRATGLPVDRLLAGVGSPNPGSLARVREGVLAIRAQVTTRIVVAALGPKMCRLAGEVADGVLFNWLTPAHARVSADWVRAGAAAAGRTPPRLYAYVRVALGAAAGGRLEEEGARYAGIPAYAAHFTRMGVKPTDTAIGAEDAPGVARGLLAWRGVVDEVVVRAITAAESADAYLALVRAARPA
jgi:alkanesulfonate monooxygenase SsuD/methylene tetrahydromethanopterin reductase-like flavin-dependent oxidoreductase (luciferase family)